MKKLLINPTEGLLEQTFREMISAANGNARVRLLGDNIFDRCANVYKLTSGNLSFHGGGVSNFSYQVSSKKTSCVAVAWHKHEGNLHISLTGGRVHTWVYLGEQERWVWKARKRDRDFIHPMEFVYEELTVRHRVKSYREWDREFIQKMAEDPLDLAVRMSYIKALQDRCEKDEGLENAINRLKWLDKVGEIRGASFTANAIMDSMDEDDRRILSDYLIDFGREDLAKAISDHSIILINS